MSESRLIVAAVFAIAAAARLIFSAWFVKRDTAWLAKTFGPSEENEAIAKASTVVQAALLAAVAGGFLTLGAA